MFAWPFSFGASTAAAGATGRTNVTAVASSEEGEMEEELTRN